MALKLGRKSQEIDNDKWDCQGRDYRVRTKALKISVKRLLFYESCRVRGAEIAKMKSQGEIVPREMCEQQCEMLWNND